ncbi:hypothetical protein [Deinococcus alpinitundrae]|uniref:P-type ATPase n=1 Tax=Deinococcus alpinitundrae TaxID=468913 RepID=UPI001379F79C|nr:hypothetical protein [Deinococcus alpinitundrae]
MGQIHEAVTLGTALLLVSGISVYQSLRSDHVLGALRDLTQPKAQLWRSGVLVNLPTEQIVLSNALLIEEGSRLPADGTVHESSDVTADESVPTGESVAVHKSGGDRVCAGTNAAMDRVWMSVKAVGVQTELGRIGRSLESLQTEKTSLQRQINTFVLRVLVNRSFTLPVFRTLRTPNRVLWLLLELTLAMLLTTLFFGPVWPLFGFTPMPLAWLG